MTQRLREKTEETPEVVFRVRDLPVFGDLILSPMAGYSDLPYRSICREYGSAMSYTEFVSALALIHGPNDRSMRMLRFRKEERPVVFQIFDNEEERLEEAAEMIEKLGPDVIDINMGCSVKHVSGRGAGAGSALAPPIRRPSAMLVVSGFTRDG